MRRYGAWAGKPDGYAERPENCVAECQRTDRSGSTFYQCTRRRRTGPGGLYCGIHARRLAMNLPVFVPKDEKEGKP